jgi:hypothetical protein
MRQNCEDDMSAIAAFQAKPYMELRPKAQEKILLRKKETSIALYTRVG